MKDIKTSRQPFIALLKRYHLVIFVVITVMLLSVAVLLLNNVVGKASGTNATPANNVTTSFDQETIDRVKQLKTSDQPSQPLNLSNGRINPFSE